MLRDLFEIGFSYVQYILLLVSAAPEYFPDYYNWPMLFLRYINLDLTELLTERNRGDNFLAVAIPEQLPLDVRLQFVLVSVIVPLLLAVVSLFSLSSKTFFFWFLFFLSGVMFLVVSLLAFLIDDPVLSSQFTSEDRYFVLYIGIALFVFAVAIAATYRWIVHTREREAKARAQRARRRKKERLRAQGVAVSSSSDEEEAEESGLRALANGGADDDDDAEFTLAGSPNGSSPAAAKSPASPTNGKKALKSAKSPRSGADAKRKRAVGFAADGGEGGDDDDADAASPGGADSSRAELKSVVSMVVEASKDPSKDGNDDDNGGDGDGGARIGIDDDDTVAGKSMDDIMKREAEQFSLRLTVERFVYASVAVFFGLLLIGAFRITAIYSDSDEAFLKGLGGALIVLGAILFLWFILGLSRRGRILMFKISTFARDNFVSALLLLVTVLYAPAVSNIVTIFNCAEYSCAAGTRPPDVFSVVRATLPETGDRCEPCNYSVYPQRCPLSLQSELCNASITAYRLSDYPMVDCNALRKYYWPASGIMFVSFVISMPLLNFILTKKSTAILEREFPLDSRQVEGYTSDETFEEKVHLSDNVAKFIYDPFQKKYMHWRSLFLFQKLLIVVSTVFDFPRSTISSEGISVMLSLIVHSVCVAYVLVTSPFTRKVENFFMIVTQIVLVLTASCALASSQNAPPPAGVFVMVAVFTFLLPAGALAIGAVLTFRDNIKKSRLREERINRAQRAAAEGDSGFDLDGGGGGDRNEMSAEMSSFRPGAPLHSMQNHMHASPLMPATHVHASAAVGASPQRLRSGAASPSQLENVPNMLGVPVTQGPTLAPMWFSSSKLNLVSPMHRYATLMYLRRRRGVNIHVGQQATTTAVILRSTGDGGDPLSNNERSFSPNNISAVNPAGGGGGGGGGNRVHRNFNFISAEHAKHRRAHDDGTGLNSPVATAAASAPHHHKMTSAFIDRIGKERWGRIKRALLDKVRADRARAEAEEQATLARGGAGGKSFFSNGAAGGGEGVKVGAGKYKNQRAMKQWDQLLQDLIRKGREEKALREGGVAAPGAANSSSSAAAGGGGGGAHLRSPATGGLSPAAMGIGGRASPAPAGGGGGNQSPNGVSPGDQAPATKRQQLALRAELKKLYEAHLERLRSQQAAVDFKINKNTIDAMQLFYVAVGVMAFVALGFCVLGIMSNTAPQSFIRSAASFANPTDTQPFADHVAGYNSWLEFTSNCCCMGFETPIDDAMFPHYAVATEKWTCENGNTKERIRAYRIYNETTRTYGLRSGLALRPLCGMSFAPLGCRVEKNTTTVFTFMSSACFSLGLSAEELALW